MRVVDAFAGIGWAMGLRALGMDEVGVELNADVCALRAGLGLATIRADVAAMPVAHLRGRVDGAIFSPPCQSFSAAGKRQGLADPRGLLVREPLRWVEAIRPRWVACEQVPDVLPYWRAVDAALRPRRLHPDNDGSHGAVLRTGANSTIVGNPYERDIIRPAPTVDSKAGRTWRRGGPAWPWERPSTTVQADVRIARPGHTGTPEKPWQFANAIPVELWELGVLQGFPADFLWHLAGTKTAQATIIGNAVPPPVAAAVVGALTGAERTVAAWAACVAERARARGRPTCGYHR